MRIPYGFILTSDGVLKINKDEADVISMIFDFYIAGASLGKIVNNFYLSAVDGILKKEQDNPSIGLLLCKSKNDLVAEYSLKDMSKPIGVSAYQITSSLPEELERQLPSVEDIQKRIKGVK